MSTKPTADQVIAGLGGDPGPQRGPSMLRQIAAEHKRVLKDLESIMAAPVVIGGTSARDASSSTSMRCVGGVLDGRHVVVRWPTGSPLRVGNHYGPLGWYHVQGFYGGATGCVKTIHGPGVVRVMRQVWLLVAEDATADEAMDAALIEIRNIAYEYEEPNILEDYASWLLWWQLKRGVDYYDPCVKPLRRLLEVSMRGELKRYSD